MSQRLTRQQMKRDEVGEALSRTALYLGSHLKLVALVLVGIVAVILLGTGIDRLVGGRRAGASDDLAHAIQVYGAPIQSELTGDVPGDLPVFDSEAARSAEARKLFETLAERRSDTGRVARAYLASIAYADGDTATARELWQELSKAHDHALAAQAELNLLSLDRAEGRGEDAEARLQASLAASSSALSEDTLLYELSQTQAVLGKDAESVETLRRLVEEHPQSPHAPEARSRISRVDGGA